MGFRREIDDEIGMLLPEQVKNRLPVADVGPDEAEHGVVQQRLQRGEVARVGQLVQTDQPVLRMGLAQVEKKVAADKTGAAGYQNGHKRCLLTVWCR